MVNESFAERFWTNVVLILHQSKKSFGWLEKEAGLPQNYVASSISKGLRIRLSNALKIASVLDKSIELLMYRQAELRITDADKDFLYGGAK